MSKAINLEERNGGAVQSGSSAPGPVAGDQSIRVGIDGGYTARRLAGSGLTGNGQSNGPRSTDDQAAGVSTIDGVTVYRTQRGGQWFVGPGRPGVLRACDYCGREYQARRSSSRFCSARCRRAEWARVHDGAERLPIVDPEAE